MPMRWLWPLLTAALTILDGRHRMAGPCAPSTCDSRSSAAGHQPMVSATGRYVIAFNGEIYNHLDLRQELERISELHHPRRGHSDTETLLAAIEARGLEPASTLRGHVCLALWDRCVSPAASSGSLWRKAALLGPERTGHQRTLLFGSELTALRAWPGFSNSIHRPALAQLLRFSSLAAPTSIYTGIQQLLPGHFVTIKEPLTSELPKSQPWWCFRSQLAESLTQPFTDPAVGLESLEAALSNAVQQQSRLMSPWPSSPVDHLR